MLQGFRNHWRRQRPNSRHRRPKVPKYEWRDVSLDNRYYTAPEQPAFVCELTDVFDCAEQQVVSLLQRRPAVNALDKEIKRLHKIFNASRTASDGLVLFFAQAPRAVLAQLQMDEKHYGYHNRQERLYELIDFNDSLVATVLTLGEADRARFDVKAKLACDRICKRVGAPNFSNEQWNAIVRGLSREIAIYFAAKNSGYGVVMTSRAQDALGIDMQVQDLETGRYINIDCKTPPSFRRRLEDLVHEGRMTPRDQVEADNKSYAIINNGHGKSTVSVVLLCVLPDLFGEISSFMFTNESPMRDKLNQLIRDHGLTDGHFGKL